MKTQKEIIEEVLKEHIGYKDTISLMELALSNQKQEFEKMIDEFYRKKMKDKQLSEEEWYSAETISGLDLQELKSKIKQQQEGK